jgi:hypothetical protein
MVFFIHRYEIPAILTRQQQQQQRLLQDRLQHDAPQLHQHSASLLPQQQSAPRLLAASRSTSNSSRNEYNDITIHQQQSNMSNTSQAVNYIQQDGHLQYHMTRDNNMSSASLRSTSTTSTMYRHSLLLQLNDDMFVEPNNTVPYSPSVPNLQPRRMADSSSFNILRWTDVPTSSTFGNDEDSFTDDVMNTVAAQAAAAVSSLHNQCSFQHVESMERENNDEIPLSVMSNQFITVDFNNNTDDYDNFDNDTVNDIDDDDKSTTDSLLPSPVSVSNPSLLVTTTGATGTTRITAATSTEFELDLVDIDVNHTTGNSDDNNNNNNEIYRSPSFIQENETSTLQSILFSSRDSFFSQGTYS